MRGKALTANRLSDGLSVWYGKDGLWHTSIEQALIVLDDALEAELKAAADAALTANLVVDANLIDLELRDGQYAPIRLRERIRAEGPTVEYGMAIKGAAHVSL